MANTAQTRKRARQTVKQRAHNVGLRSTLRTAIKKIKSAIEGGDTAKPQKKHLKKMFPLLTESLIKKLFTKIKQLDINQD